MCLPLRFPHLWVPLRCSLRHPTLRTPLSRALPTTCLPRTRKVLTFTLNKHLRNGKPCLPSWHVRRFGGLRAPPRNFLFHGPPGTGKTLLVQKVGSCAAGPCVFALMLPSTISLVLTHRATASQPLPLVALQRRACACCARRIPPICPHSHPTHTPFLQPPLLTPPQIAAEAGLRLLCLPPSAVLSKWSGEAEQAVRRTFAAARALAPAAIFMVGTGLCLGVLQPMSWPSWAGCVWPLLICWATISSSRCCTGRGAQHAL